MNRIVWIVALTALNWTTFTQGAPINWGRVKDVSSSTEVINRGTLIEAFNAGGSTSGRDQTVNGVLFTGTSALLSQARDQDVFSRDTGDAAYNALLSSMDTGGGTDLVSLEVGGGKLSVGTEYRIQVWWAADQASRVVSVVVGDGESSANTVTLNSTPGQFTIGSFIADGNMQTMTLESPDFGDTYLTAYQIRNQTNFKTYKFQDPELDTSLGNKLAITLNLKEGHDLLIGLAIESKFNGPGQDVGNFNHGRKVSGNGPQTILFEAKDFNKKGRTNSKANTPLEWSKISSFTIILTDAETKQKINLASLEGSEILKRIELVNP
jgi:hypothetical protein